MDLKKIYTDLLLNIGFEDKEIQQNWTELQKAYSKKSRYYHNLTHLEEMIELFDQYKTQLQKPDEILFSIFYHDIIYKVTRKDNELKSAEHAVKVLDQNSVLDKDLIFEAICATQLHQHNKIEDINWLIDFDLKINQPKNGRIIKSILNKLEKNIVFIPTYSTNPGVQKL
ncbi:hypothetical protein ACFSJW_19685 [Flavobacterium artemisiae]|uniref:Metal-dependent HD superfamily phosphohydrolase n=1 Tax=Flavobacterium artemisiae TaxID=2126556 RepID=A0ABW4HAL8_9FLAO